MSCVVDHILQVFNTDQIQNLKNCYATPKNSVPQRGLKVLLKKMPQRKASEMGREALIEAAINGESGGACDRLDHGKTMFQMDDPDAASPPP